MSGGSKFHAGDKYGHLTLLEDTKERTKEGGIIWKCKCDCGNIVIRRQDSIYESLVKNCVISCGCKVSKEIGKREAYNSKRIELARKAIGQIEGTTMQGICRQSLNKNNTSGHIGVSHNKRSGKWRARISLRGKEVSGVFDTKEQAIAYREYLEEVYFNPIKKRYEQKNGKFRSK